MKLLTESLDLVDPHHFLRLSKAMASPACTVSQRMEPFRKLWK